MRHPPPIPCPFRDCTGKISYEAEKCSLGIHNVDPPNVRAAQTGQSILRRKSADKRAEIISKGQESKLNHLEELIEHSGIAINMDLYVIKELLTGNIYSNYYKQRMAGIRKAWPPDLAKVRGQADNWLFPDYFTNLIYGCLIPCSAGDNHIETDGLARYGNCTIHIHSMVVEKLASLFNRDSMWYYRDFCQHHDNITEDCAPEDASIWNDRVDLAICKCADQLLPSLPLKNIGALLLQASVEKDKEDTFIEANLFTSLNMDMIAGIRLSVNLTRPGQSDTWEEIEDLAAVNNLPTSTL